MGVRVGEGDTSLLGSLLPNLQSTEQMLTNRSHLKPTCSSPTAGRSRKPWHHPSSLLPKSITLALLVLSPFSIKIHICEWICYELFRPGFQCVCFYFVLFFGRTHSLPEFPDCRTNPNHCNDNTKSLNIKPPGKSSVHFFFAPSHGIKSQSSFCTEEALFILEYKWEVDISWRKVC